ncbi:MAG: transglycosylase SLT domain-containing protein [Chitinophagales bacterium]
MKKILLFTFICLMLFAKAQDNPIKVDVEQESLFDLEKKTFDLFYKAIWFEEDSLVEQSINMPKHEITRLSEEEIIAMMNKIPSTFPLCYNDIIKQYIEQFSDKRRFLVAQSLGLGEFYFPIFEEALDKYDDPLVLKYLPVIESSINPFAKSSAGARGLWQFMLRTGQIFGLDVNDYVDERCDPYLSSDAAAKYLHQLYTTYKDWLLVLAAYNAGPGNVNKAIGLAGGKKSYWEIRPFLPKETREYVPKFIACVFVMYYHDVFDIKAKKPLCEFYKTDTILIKEKVSLRYISELTGIDSSYIHFINPSLKSGIIPKSEKGFYINVPYDYLGQFSYLENYFFEDPYLAELKVEVKEVAVPTYTVYKVKSGDTLGHIGARYGVGVSQIKKWNSLKSDALKIGQKLILYI